jgi:capsular exopolysaccharide synthesis family protein
MNPNDTNSAAKTPATAGDTQLLQASLLKMAQGQDSAPSGPPALSATPTLSGLLHTLKRRWAVAFGLATVLSALAVAAVFVVNWPKYVGKLRIQIAARQAGPEDIEFPIYKASLEALVKSPVVLNNALNAKTSDGRDINDLELVRSHGMGIVDWLELNVKTDFLLGPETLRVTLAADQPDDAAEVLNAIGTAFLTEYNRMERAKKDDRLNDLRRKKADAERDLTHYRKDLEAQVSRLDVKDRDAIQTNLENLKYKMQAAETARRNCEEKISEANGDILTNKARLQSIDKAQIPEEAFLELVSKDAIILAHLDRLTKIELEKADAERKFNPPYLNDVVVPLRKERIKLEELKAQRERELRPKIEERWRNAMRAEWTQQIVLAEEKIKSFTSWHEERVKEIKSLERLLGQAGTGNWNKPAQIAEAEDKIDLTRKTLESITQKIGEVDIEGPQSRVRIVTPASPPTARDTRTQARLAGAGGLGFFIMTLFGVAFFEFRARRINMIDDVSHGLGLNVVGAIPAMPARSRKSGGQESAAEQQWMHQLQESVDAIRTVILHQARTNALHVIMVTSANSGEGKTTLTTQLAASLARGWKRTLVIDADLRHPAAHKLFDVAPEPGLAEVLRGEVEPGDAIRATPFARLWVLPAGNGDNHAIQALAQDNVGSLFEQLKQQYDFILIDTPPVLPVTDTLLLGQHADGIVLSVLRDVSRAPALYAAQQKLAPLGVAMLGAVVLGTEAEFGSQSYGYALTQAAK